MKHGFVIPNQDHLLVEDDVLVKYLHLVIYGYHECLFCGSARNSLEGAQQHMQGKNHCRFDLSGEDSEYRDFYHWEAPDPDQASEPVVMDDAIRLPSGKILSHRNHVKTPRILDASKAAAKKSNALPAGSGGRSAPGQELVLGGDDDGDGMSKRLAKQLHLAQAQLGKMRESDKAMLLRMPLKQQRMMLLQSRRDSEWALKRRTDLFIKVQIRLGQV